MLILPQYLSGFGNTNCSIFTFSQVLTSKLWWSVGWGWVTREYNYHIFRNYHGNNITRPENVFHNPSWWEGVDFALVSEIYSSMKKWVQMSLSWQFLFHFECSANHKFMDDLEGKGTINPIHSSNVQNLPTPTVKVTPIIGGLLDVDWVEDGVDCACTF